ALMLSRVLAARLLLRAGKSQLVLGAAVLSLGGCALLLARPSLGWLFLGTALVGLSYGPILPTALAIPGGRLRNRWGTVFGLLFSIALVGGMMFPWVFGQVSQRVSLRVGMTVPALGAVAIIVLSAVILARERQTVAIAKPEEGQS